MNMDETTTNTLTKINTQTRRTWQSDSSSGSSTAERYNLEEDDTTPILAYIYGGDISTTSQKDLCELLDNDTNRRQRVTKKTIPRFTSNLEVKRHDLYTVSEQEEFRSLPNYDSPLASIRLPSNVYWGRVFGGYQNLFIVSPETSPEGSEAGSQSSLSSARWSPGGVLASPDAEAGAHRE